MITCVVTRHLPNARPVPSVVLLPPKEYEEDSLESYFTSEANKHITEFKKQFVEFNSAEFYIDIVESTQLW
jgi:hypothetical protein